MPIYRYVCHPGAGQNPPAGGAQQTLQTGTNFVWREQLQQNGQDTETHFQGITIPDNPLGSGNLIFRPTWRQIGANVGPNIVAGIDYAQVLGGPRDVAPTVITPVTIPGAGVADGEFAHEFSVSMAGFSVNEEVFFKVRRVGTDGSDDLGTDIALVKVEVIIPASDTFVFESEWDGNHPILGVYELWVDAAGRLRINNGPPASDLDGEVVGEQS